MAPVPICWDTLVPAIQAGEESASATLYQAFATVIRAQAIRAVGRDYAEDVIHDAYIRVLDAVRRGAIREPRAMWAVLATTGRRQIIDTIRRRIAESLPPVSCEPASRAPGPETILAAKERLSIALGAMTEDERRCVLSHPEQTPGPGHDRTMPEEARRMGVSFWQYKRLRTSGRRKALRALAQAA